MQNRRAILRLLAAAPLAQMAQIPSHATSSVQPVQRRRVIPMDVIDRFKLRPTMNQYGAFLLGEDGQPYDFDDVLAVIFEMTADHWRTRK